MVINISQDSIVPVCSHSVFLIKLDLALRLTIYPTNDNKQPSHASTLSITPYTCSFHLLQCFPDIYEGPNDRNLCIS